MGKSLAQSAREHKPHPTLICRRQKQRRRYARSGLCSRHLSLHCRGTRAAELKLMIGRLTMENYLLKKLVAARSAFASDRRQWGQPMLEVSTQYAAGHTHSSVVLMSNALSLARSNYYRFSVGGEQTDNERRPHEHRRQNLALGSRLASPALPARTHPEIFPPARSDVYGIASSMKRSWKCLIASITS